MTMAIPLRPAVTAAVALIATGITIFPAAAGAHDGQEVRPRLERACKRIPTVEHRLDTFLERLDGDRSVRGSLAWLEDKQALAVESDREHLATVLENRLAVRTKARELLLLRQDEVATWRDLCVEHGVDL